MIEFHCEDERQITYSILSLISHQGVIGALDSGLLGLGFRSMNGRVLEKTRSRALTSMHL